MASKKFDLQTVIAQATELFWQQGFAATSVSQLTAATGLKPGSLYNEFGSKEGLFKAALSYYAQNNINAINEKLAQSTLVLTGIERILDGLVQDAHNQDYCGCFLIKSQLELAPQKSALYYDAQHSLKQVEENYFEHLRTEFSEEQAKDYARQLMMVIFAIRVYGYQSEQVTVLQQTYHSLLPWLKN